MITVKNLRVEVKKDKGNIIIFEDLNISIIPLEYNFLIGKSGVGKTVFAKTISGLLSEDFLIKSGRFFVEENEVEYEDIERMTGYGIFYTPQNAKASLNPLLRIKTQFDDIGNFDIKKIKSLMSFSGFDNPERILNSYPHQLSEGECRRIVIITGIIMRPKLFILDEPTSGLDINSQKKVLALIDKIHKKNTVLMITHNSELFKNKENILKIEGKNGQ